MKLVVDIEDNLYIGIKKDKYHKGKLYKMIRNGTPLPKGHGRLGDLDALEKEMIGGIKAGNLEDGFDKYTHINNVDDCVECVRYADTIIEADKGEE